MSDHHQISGEHVHSSSNGRSRRRRTPAPIGKPYFPSNPSRCATAGSAADPMGKIDPYGKKKEARSRQGKLRNKQAKLVSRARCCDSPPHKPHCCAPAATSLDDVASPNRRLSRWESDAPKDHQLNNSMPQRRRELSPSSPDSPSSSPNSRRNSSAPTAASTTPLKMVRRKLSGDLMEATTTLQSAASASLNSNMMNNSSRPTACSVRRKSKKPAQKNTFISATDEQEQDSNNESSNDTCLSLGQMLDSLDSQEAETDHVYFRRSRSNKFLFIRDDSVGDLNNKSSLISKKTTTDYHPGKLQFRRRSDVRALTIPPIFASDAMTNHNDNGASARSRRDPAMILKQLNLNDDEEDEEEDDLQSFGTSENKGYDSDIFFVASDDSTEESPERDFRRSYPFRKSNNNSSNNNNDDKQNSNGVVQNNQLGDLVKSLDEDSDHSSHIFCSHRQLVAFDDDEEDSDGYD